MGPEAADVGVRNVARSGTEWGQKLTHGYGMGSDAAEHDGFADARARVPQRQLVSHLLRPPASRSCTPWTLYPRP
eukprot:2187407-Rhodomonas_salina.1